LKPGRALSRRLAGRSLLRRIIWGWGGGEMEYLSILLIVLPIVIIIFINSKIKAEKNLNSIYCHLLVYHLMKKNTS
jgi:hypothetical protein